MAELATDEPGATQLVVTSTATHRCDRYAGSVVVTSRDPEVRRYHFFVGLRFAACDGDSTVPAAPLSVNDTAPTWGDEGHARWARRGPTSSDPGPQPEGSESPTSPSTDETTAS